MKDIKALQFIIELTNTCNLRCKYCYLYQANSLVNYNSSKFMDENTAFEVINYLYKLAKQNNIIIYVDFLDGEPLINFKILKFMVEKGRAFEKQENKKLFIFRFTTNGTLLNDKIVDFANQNDIYFNISVDGLPASHDVNRVFLNGKGSSKIVFDKVVAYKDKVDFGIVSTFSPSTLTYLLPSIDYFFNINLKHVEINFALGISDPYNIDMLVKEYKSCINKFLSNYQNYIFSPSYVILDRVLNMMFSPRGNSSTNCIFPYKITKTGQVMSCDRINISENKVISDVHDYINIENLVDNHLCRGDSITLCNKCEYRCYCSPCNVSLQQIDRETLEPIFCIIMKTLITEAYNFYGRNKSNLKLALHFSPQLLKKIQDNRYIIEYKSNNGR